MPFFPAARGSVAPSSSVGRLSRGQPAAAARTFDIGDFPLRVASAAVSDFYTMTMTTADKDRERGAGSCRTVEREGAREGGGQINICPWAVSSFRGVSEGEKEGPTEGTEDRVTDRTMTQRTPCPSYSFRALFPWK